MSKHKHKEDQIVNIVKSYQILFQKLKIKISAKILEEINQIFESSDAKGGTQHTAARFGNLKLSNAGRIY